MSLSARGIGVRLVTGLLFIAAGFFHSLYYLGGLLGSWEKDLWNIMQLAAGLVFAGIGLLMVLFRRRTFRGLTLWMIRVCQVGIGLFLVVFLTFQGLIWNAGRAAEPEQGDYLLVLGARVRGETISLSLKERLDQALVYLKEYPDTPVILSGGQGRGEAITEAEAMRRYLVQNGVKEEQLHLENRSTNTYENMIFTRQLLESQDVPIGSVKMVLVTNDFHMYRAKFLAERTGFQVLRQPAATPSYTLPKSYTREFAALIKSYLFDR